MKKSEVADIVTVLVAAYPAARMSERTCQVYETMLADLDFEAAQRAVARLVATSKFVPTIAEIRAMACEQKLGPRRSGIEAWADVGAEIRRVGAYERPRFSDPIVAECVQVMGWRGLCLGSNDAADRARFCELYDRFAERARADAVAGPAIAALVGGGPNGHLNEYRQMALTSGRVTG